MKKDLFLASPLQQYILPMTFSTQHSVGAVCVAIGTKWVGIQSSGVWEPMKTSMESSRMTGNTKWFRGKDQKRSST